MQTGSEESQGGLYNIHRNMRVVTWRFLFSECSLTSTTNVAAHLLYHHTPGYDTGAIAGILIAPSFQSI
ncbi:hypothetical protein BC937DRAFT_88157 [Endogone sp. FLAS-F59071]|nr:hypothetical protein BC937DRAFT_88157 [Endogone sp. FLAS-F59071]|eukprot:RUS18932.1 hypothetical protein BC937DRAFT_88157 [Endogone sp. FLAS-F59071]